MKKDAVTPNKDTNTEHKRKSAIITTGIMIALLFIIFIFGLTYLDPPEESGIAVNFGTTETGSGNIETKKTPKQSTAKAQPEEVEVKPQETVPEEQPETTPTESATEEVVTQESEESIAIKKAEEAKRKADEEAKEAKKEADRIAKEKQEAEEKLKAEQAKKRAEFDAMTEDLNNSEGDKDGEDTEGEGPEDKGGNKGDPKGDPYAKTYFGKPGSGTGGQGGSGLGNRTRLQTAKEIPDCDFAGRVVLDITVNRQGKVIDAKRGAGTLAAEQCLIDAAIKAAYKFKWNADGNAPENQYGVIEFNFTLGGK